MKNSCIFYFPILLMGLMTSCHHSQPTCEDVVYETYVHRYGVPLDSEEWSARGQSGQVVAVRKDGVVMTHTYDSGILHGDCTYTFPYRETIQKRETYDQGRVVRELVYYPSGFPQREISYQSPEQHSQVNWYETGAPQCHEEYENGKLVHGEYYTLANQVESRVDDFNGSCIRRDGQGQLQSIDSVQDGKMVLRATYHPNGSPACVEPYVNDKIEGKRCTFLPDGEPATIEEWANGVQQGKTIVFENGERISEVTYVDGYQQGVESRYRDGNTVVQEVSWVKGKKQGPCYTYAGDTAHVDWYFGDHLLVNKATYDVLCNQYSAD